MCLAYASLTQFSDHQLNKHSKKAFVAGEKSKGKGKHSINVAYALLTHHIDRVKVAVSISDDTRSFARLAAKYIHGICAADAKSVHCLLVASCVACRCAVFSVFRSSCAYARLQYLLAI
jgi:predicted ATP-dependent Lon-type protease